MGCRVTGVVLLLAVIFLFLCFMVWPFLQFCDVLLGAAIKDRADLDPRTPQGRWRLLGIASIIAAALLGVHARGYDVLSPVLAWLRIDAGNLGKTFPSIFGLLAGVLLFAVFAGGSFARAKRFDSRRAGMVVSEDTRPPLWYTSARSAMTPGRLTMWE